MREKEPGRMRKILRYTVAIIFLIALTGCGDKLAGDIKVEWEADKRSYKAVVKDDDGTARVQLVCQYVGKAPEEPVDTVIRRNWQTQDTDFYHYKLVNLTDKPIELMNVSFRLKEGKGEKIYDTKGQTAIDSDWGAHIIPPGESLSRRNSWVYGIREENVLHKIYTAKTEGVAFKIDTQLVYNQQK